MRRPILMILNPGNIQFGAADDIQMVPVAYVLAIAGTTVTVSNTDGFANGQAITFLNPDGTIYTSALAASNAVNAATGTLTLAYSVPGQQFASILGPSLLQLGGTDGGVQLAIKDETVMVDYDQVETEVENVSVHWTAEARFTLKEYTLDQWGMLSQLGYSTRVASSAAAGTAEVASQTVTGAATGAGTITITVTAANIPGSPLAVPVATIQNGDTTAQVAAKIRLALLAVAAITNLYAVGGTGATYTLTALTNQGNDTTLAMAFAAGATGATAGASSITTPGVAGAVVNAANILNLAATPRQKRYGALFTIPKSDTSGLYNKVLFFKVSSMNGLEYNHEKRNPTQMPVVFHALGDPRRPRGSRIGQIIQETALGT